MVRFIVFFVVPICVPALVVAQPFPVSPDCKVNRTNLQSCDSMAKKYRHIVGGNCFSGKCTKIAGVWTCNKGSGLEVSVEGDNYRDVRDALASESGSTIVNEETVTDKCGTLYPCWCNPFLMIDPDENPCNNQGEGEDYFPVELWIGPLNCTGSLI